MWNRTGCACWAICLAACALLAEPPAKPSPPAPGLDSVNDLIERLGARDFRQREQAQRELLALGMAARPRLKQMALSTESPEIERRLSLIIEKIDRHELFEPRRVRFQGVQTIEELIKLIERQTGYRVVLEDDNLLKQQVKVIWNDTPFWEALGQVCDAAGLSMQFAGDESNSMMLSDTNTYDPFVSIFGPFRSTATGISLNSHRQLSGLIRNQAEVQSACQMNLSIQLQSESKNPMVGIGVPTITRAVDDQGHDLRSFDSNSFLTAYYAPSQYRTHSQYLQVSLSKPHRDATVIKELQGKVEVTLLSGSKTELTIDHLAKVRNQHFVSRKTDLFIESVSEPTEDGFTISFSAKLLHGGVDEFTHTAMVAQRLEAYDENGVKFVTGGATNPPQMPNSNFTTLNFNVPQGQKTGTPAKLVLVEWLTVPRVVEFSFQNIPLP